MGNRLLTAAEVYFIPWSPAVYAAVAVVAVVAAVAGAAIVVWAVLRRSKRRH